ncbi:MAG: TIGR00730 family Rossman fold protein [Rhodospirillales bacterium]
MWPSSLCVYCGASAKGPETHAVAARRLGEILAENTITLVYGGARGGLMGTIADAALAGGGRVCGVIPGFLDRVERTHHGLSELQIVDSMHARKRVMTEKADAFCVLPGGLGTLDEAFEAITWAQLGLHAKPLVFLDIDGYWQPLLALLQGMDRQGYLRVPASQVFAAAERPEAVLAALRDLRPANAPDRLERS